jgi:DNA-binding HxlR family transcriptional regulator
MFRFSFFVVAYLCFRIRPMISKLACGLPVAAQSAIIHLQNASEIFYILPVAREKPLVKRRSLCPLNASVEMLGDRWSLLILRDMMVWGFKTYKEFLSSHEKIATNILANRLRKLEESGIISSKPDPSDQRKLIYVLTAKGIDLAPVLAEMVLWASRHEKTGNQQLIRQLNGNKDQFIAHIRKTWSEHATP